MTGPAVSIIRTVSKPTRCNKPTCSDIRSTQLAPRVWVALGPNRLDRGSCSTSHTAPLPGGLWLLGPAKSSATQSLLLGSSAFPCRVLQDDQLGPRSSGCSRGPLSRWGWRVAGSRAARAAAAATTASATRRHGLRRRDRKLPALLMGVPQRPQTIRPARLRSARMVQLPHWEQAMVLAILIFPAWLGGVSDESAISHFFPLVICPLPGRDQTA